MLKYLVELEHRQILIFYQRNNVISLIKQNGINSSLNYLGMFKENDLVNNIQIRIEVQNEKE